MKKSTKKFLMATAATVAGMCAYNRHTANSAKQKNMLPPECGTFYLSRQGNVFFRKTGSGTPILLVHDTNSASSSIEWSKITDILAENHTVYAIDLFGCGLSAKPKKNYTPYLYIKQIADFAKNVIREQTDVVATNLSAAAVIMANQMDPALFKKIILINPPALKVLDATPKRADKFRKAAICLPLVGDFLYNMVTSECQIQRTFRRHIFEKGNPVPHSIVDMYFEAAHTGDNAGRFLYASLLGKKMGLDIRQPVREIDGNVSIIASPSIRGNDVTVEEYLWLNPGIEVSKIHGCGLCPQLEEPVRTAETIEKLLK